MVYTICGLTTFYLYSNVFPKKRIMKENHAAQNDILQNLLVFILIPSPTLELQIIYLCPFGNILNYDF